MRDYFWQLWHWRTATGLAVGGAGGTLYSILIGCKSGCAITSSPILSALFGAAIGASLLMPARRRANAPSPDARPAPLPPPAP